MVSKRVFLGFYVAFSMACAGVLAPKVPANLSPEVTAKFYATYAIKDLDVVRDIAADVHSVSPTTLSSATLGKIVDWHESLVKVIHSAPDSWRAAVLAGLTELKGKLSVTEYATLQPYLDSVRTFTMEVR